MQVHTSQLSIKKFKISPIRRAPTNLSRSLKFLRRPHFVGHFLCMRSCFNLQLSNESSCKAPSFYVRDPLGRDLASALDFQKTYFEAVCSALEATFVDNDNTNYFEILNPLYMPRRQVGLASWGVMELDRLLQQYGVQKMLGVQVLPPLG